MSQFEIKRQTLIKNNYEYHTWRIINSRSRRSLLIRIYDEFSSGDRSTKVLYKHFSNDRGMNAWYQKFIDAKTDNGYQTKLVETIYQEHPLQEVEAIHGVDLRESIDAFEFQYMGIDPDYLSGVDDDEEERKAAHVDISIEDLPSNYGSW